MDVMFGFFEQSTDFDPMSPIALPEQYGTFSVSLGGQVRSQDLLVDCDPELYFLNTDKEEAKVNFFPDTRLMCLNTQAIEMGGSGFI